MKVLSKIIRFLFLFLFLATPLIFTFFNSELFELPKMYFVYLITIIITILHLINWVQKNVPLLKKSLLNIPLFVFLISQIISTVLSIDIHTSIFGYYSRLNGGLLSIVCYSLLYFIFIIYIDKKFIQRTFQVFFITGLIVSIFGILEHFGIDKDMWIQDVQSRVFSTLGQPNWLAAYLAILLPLSLNYLFQSTKKLHKLFFVFTSLAFYSCILFTKSKSGIIATLTALFIFFFFKFVKNLKDKGNFSKELKITAPILITFIIISLCFKNPIQEKIFPQKPDNTTPTTEITNLNITPSEDIRKIVWIGAIDLWKKYPLFGTGVETFAYSYYWTRPISHNLTSEWDFLYNKAHNEYINFLATTGVFGLTAYLILIVFSLIKIIQKSRFDFLASYISILITNLAGFSVVTTSLFFFIIPGLVDQESDDQPKSKRKLNIFIPIFLIIGIFLISKTINFYTADIAYAKSETLESYQDYSNSYQLISQSLSLRPNEPLYLNKSGLLLAKLATQTKDQQYIDLAINHIDLSVAISPTNISFWQQRAQTFYYLSSIDIKYFQEAIDSLLQASTLAPTDPKNYFSIGQFLESANLEDEAIPYYQKAIELKSNYDHAYFALGQIYFNQKKYDLAQKYLDLDLQYAPTNTSAQEMIQKIPLKKTK